jgi:hypothetical protein
VVVLYTTGFWSGAVHPVNANECLTHDASIIPHAIINTTQAPVELPNVKQALCEPSAGVIAPWNPHQILVGDNEAEKQLYVFERHQDRLQFTSVIDMAKKVEDIEALVPVNGGVLVVGSHSRNSQCKIKPDRLRLLWLKPKGDSSFETHLISSANDQENRFEEITNDPVVCVAQLFTSPTVPHAREVCEALKGAKSHPSCNTFNIEGAFSTREGRIWFGLRAPLVNNQAVMLRVVEKPIDQITDLRFDRVVLLALNNRGIRELALSTDGEHVWGIAGPEVDKAEPFRLWSISAAHLQHQTQLQLQRDIHMDPRCLPTSSEGMVIFGNEAMMLIDREKDDNNEKRCKSDGQLYTLPLQP